MTLSSSKVEQVGTPGSADWHTHSAFMPLPPNVSMFETVIPFLQVGQSGGSRSNGARDSQRGGGRDTSKTKLMQINLLLLQTDTGTVFVWGIGKEQDNQCVRCETCGSHIFLYIVLMKICCQSVDKGLPSWLSRPAPHPPLIRGRVRRALQLCSAYQKAPDARHSHHDGYRMHYCRSRDFTTRRAPTPPDASYIPDASGPDALYDTVRRVVHPRRVGPRHLVRHSTTRRTVSYDACTTLYDTVRHCTTLYDASYSVVRRWYDIVRHSTTLYDTVRHSTTQYDTVRHCTTQYDTVRHSTTQYDASYCVVRHIYVYICTVRCHRLPA